MKRLSAILIILLLAWSGAAIADNTVVTGGGGSASIDDTKGNGDTAFTWSADKIFDQLAGKASQTSGLASALPGTCTVPAAYFATDTKTWYLCTASNTWSMVYSVGADGSYRATFTNNSAITPTASADEIYFEANVLKVNENGTERTVAKLVASNTAALGTSEIASGACASAVTVAGTGIATTDVINWGFNGTPVGATGYAASANGMLTIIAYPTSGNANFLVCNNTAAAVTPGAITLNWNVVR